MSFILLRKIFAALKIISIKVFYYSAMAAGVMAHNLQTGQQYDAVPDGSNELWNMLSENEREFLKLACTELTYQQIADKMKLSPKTIDGYRESLFVKFKVKNRVGLAVYAVKNGLVKI